MQKILVVIAGPTAIGKTAFGIALAKQFSSEIVSADSRQVYTQMKIGTARPSVAELENIPHHLLGHISIHQNYTVADFAKEATQKIHTLFQHHSIVIMVGGSGLYLDAVCNGLDELPDSMPEIKSQLIQVLQSEGIQKLQQQLLQLDPEYYHTIDLNNPHRLIRAIEVCLITGKKFSDLRSGKKIQHPFHILKMGLTLDRIKLYAQINLRVEQMMQQGLLNEAKELFSQKHLKALKTVGYTELFEHLESKISEKEAVKLIQQNTRHYAKRQMTWFRKDTEICWLDVSDSTEAIKKGVKMIRDFSKS